MKKIILLIFVSIVVNAQYTIKDTLLLRETFKRNFSHQIFDEYYHSGVKQKIKAWLLSISHSEDTNFVKKITKLNFAEYAPYICFALGQLGRSDTSSEYLLDKIFNSKFSKFEKHSIEALGLVADSSSFNILLDKYFDKKINNFEGISISIANYLSRHKGNEKISKVLFEELNDYKSIKAKTEALYALSRYKATDEFYEKLISIISEKSLTNENIVNYALKSFVKLKQFPFNRNLIERLINNKNWTIRTEAAKALVYIKEWNRTSYIDTYLKLLNDKNPNVSLQAARSASGFLYIDDSIKSYLTKQLTNHLKTALSNNLADEIYISLCKLNPEVNFIELKKDTKISTYAFIKGLNYLALTEKEKLEILLQRFNSSDNYTKLEIVNSLTNFQKSFMNNHEYVDTVFKLFFSDEPAIISILADGLDKDFISKYNLKLQAIIMEVIKKHLNNVQFMESLLSLSNLSNKIGKEFSYEVKEVLSKSNLFSIQKLSGKNFIKNDKVFDNLVPYLFKYNRAIVRTGSGSFVIEFSHEYSPVSVANFCYLAEKGFYKNVIFHRVVPNFVIQTGDPSETGWGGPGYKICSEFSFSEFRKGAVGMASAGKDTEGSQWFVMHSYYPHLNRKYTNFGSIVKGYEVISNIKQWDKIYSIELFK